MAETRQVPFKVTDPERIDSRRYFDPAFYQAEVDHLWPHVWQMACRLEQIAEVGDWIEYSNLGKSVIVVRAKDGIKAYHNACRHRGVPLVESNGHGNCKGKGFICPFHGWRWNTDGQNTFVYGKHLFDARQLDAGEIALRACRVETWGGCAFINHDPDAPSLHDTLGPVLKALTAHGQDGQRAEWCVGVHLPANWKVALEAFMEGYHVMRTHPQLQKASPVLYNTMYGHDTGGIGDQVNPDWTKEQNVAAQMRSLELLSEGMNGMVHAKEVEIARGVTADMVPDDPEQMVMVWFGTVMHMISATLKARGEDVPDLPAVAVSDPVNAVEYLFPNYMLLPFFTSTSAYRIRPTGPESCFFELWSLTTSGQVRQALRMALRHGLVIVADGDAGLSGAAIFVARTARYLVLDALTVLPEQRRSGVAWAVAARAQAVANAAGLGVTLVLAATNPMPLEGLAGRETWGALHLVPMHRFRGQGRLRALHARVGARRLREAVMFRDPQDPGTRLR